jgi:hypothetical protein
VPGQTRDRRERLLRKYKANLSRQDRLDRALADVRPISEGRLAGLVHGTYDLLAQMFRLESLLCTEGVNV